MWRVCVEGVCVEGVCGGCVWRVCVQGVCGGCVWRVCVQGVCGECVYVEKVCMYVCMQVCEFKRGWVGVGWGYAKQSKLPPIMLSGKLHLLKILADALT